MCAIRLKKYMSECKFYTLHCTAILLSTMNTLLLKSYSPSFNLISHFIYAQTVFPSDNTDKKFYMSLVCVFSLKMAQKGPKHVGYNRNMEWLITAD